MSALKTVLLVVAVLGIGAGMIRSEEVRTPVQNYDGYGPRPTYPKDVYANSWVGSQVKLQPSKSEVRDRRAKCLDLKATDERYRCMAETDDE